MPQVAVRDTIARPHGRNCAAKGKHTRKELNTTELELENLTRL